MLSLWNEIQDLKGKIGQAEIKTFGKLDSSPKTVTVTFSFIPNYIFVIAQGRGDKKLTNTTYKSHFFLKTDLIKNGSSGNSSVYSQVNTGTTAAPTATFSASLNNNTATVTITSSITAGNGTSIEKGLILAF